MAVIQLVQICSNYICVRRFCHTNWRYVNPPEYPSLFFSNRHLCVEISFPLLRLSWSIVESNIQNSTPKRKQHACRILISNTEELLYIKLKFRYFGKPIRFLPHIPLGILLSLDSAGYFSNIHFQNICHKISFLEYPIVQHICLR